MKCPVCKEGMLTFEHDQVEVDHCPACRGTWLDKGELGLLLQTKEENRLIASFQTCSPVGEKKRKCPICLKSMEKISCGTDSKLYIDRCVNHHGLWFDLGELEEIIHFFRGEEKISHWLRELFSQK